jgi:hypothetical protein
LAVILSILRAWRGTDAMMINASVSEFEWFTNTIVGRPLPGILSGFSITILEKKMASTNLKNEMTAW